MRLFDEASLRKLEQLTLSADSVRVGVMKGNRRSRKRGASIEFADYRDYTQGDDLRRLDWNIFARLERPYVKLTEEEEDLAIHILVDTSASMNWPLRENAGELAENKLRLAMQLAGALGYVGLLSGDLVLVTLIDSSGRNTWGPFRNRQNGWPLIQYLEANYEALTARDARARRGTSLDLSLRDYALRARRPGLLLLISDLLSPGGFHTGLNAIQSRGYEITVLHLLSSDEASPALTGDLKMIDVETGEAAEVTLDALALEEYADRLESWQSDISAYCGARGIHYLNIIANTPWERVITEALRRQGIVR
jgi:uncharacterized protein (DUF58 family)